MRDATPPLPGCCGLAPPVVRHAGRLRAGPVRLPGLSLAIAFTGILATLPYIALQLVGIQAVLDVMGLGGGEDAGWFRKDLPLFVAFADLDQPAPRAA